MAKTRFKNGSRKANSLAKLNYDRKIVLAHIESVDSDLYAITLALVRYTDPKRVNAKKTHAQITKLIAKKPSSKKKYWLST